MGNTVLLLDIGSTQMVADYDDYFDAFPLGTFTLSSCRLCAGLTAAPSSHLEWHIRKGDFHVSPAAAEEHDDERSDSTGGAGAGLGTEVRHPVAGIQDRDTGAGSAVHDGAAQEPQVDPEGVAQPGP